MKEPFKFCRIGLAGIITGLTVAIHPHIAIADEIQFICTKRYGSFYTMAQSPLAVLPFIHWNAKSVLVPSKLTSEQQCYGGTAQIRAYHAQGKLNYLKMGKHNNQKVFCMVSKTIDPCKEILFSLKPGYTSNASIFDHWALRCANDCPNVIEEPSKFDSTPYEERKFYLDVNGYLQRLKPPSQRSNPQESIF
jgi:hypothetical protein